MKQLKTELTLEEIEHRDRLRVLYCSVFVCTVFVWVLRFALGGLAGLAAPHISNYYLKTALILLADGVSIVLPFALYQKLRRDPFRPIFSEQPRSEHPSLRCVIGILSAFCLAVCGMAVTDFGLAFLENQGVHSAITLPDFGVNMAQNLYYVVLSTLIYSFSYEFSFRGIAMSAMRGENRATAVVISALAFAFVDGEPHHIIVRLAVGFVLALFYLRVRSLWAVVAVHAAVQVGICVWWLRPLQENSYIEHFLLLIGLVLGIGSAAFLFFPRREPDAQTTKNRVSFSVFLRSFGIWLVLGLVAFNMLSFTFYMEPAPDLETPEHGRQDPLFNDPTDRAENIPNYKDGFMD